MCVVILVRLLVEIELSDQDRSVALSNSPTGAAHLDLTTSLRVKNNKQMRIKMESLYKTCLQGMSSMSLGTHRTSNGLTVMARQLSRPGYMRLVRMWFVVDRGLLFHAFCGEESLLSKSYSYL